MVIYKKSSGEIAIPDQTSFSAHQILERTHIERWIENNPQILGEELMILTTEYDKFDKTNERLDLMAIDPNGTLVVIELKRDDSGKNVDTQAIKYAAYCSTLTLEDVVSIHKQYLLNKGINKTMEEVRDIILQFIQNSDFEQIDDRPRIIIVSNNFRPEVTASVMWLKKYGLDIKCVRLIPYEIDNDTIGLEAVTIIPVPEAEDYIVKVGRKENATTNLTVTQQEYLDFYTDLVDRLRSNFDAVLPQPKPQSFYQIPTGVGGIHFEFLFHGRPRDSFGVELHFEKGNRDQNKTILNEIVAKYKFELDTVTGEKLVIQEEWGQRWSRIYYEKKEGNITEDLKQWAVDLMIKFYNTVSPYFAK